LEAFSQLGTELDAATQRQLDRGARMVELLKQPQYKPYKLSDQVVSIFAGAKGYLDTIPLNKVLAFEVALLKHVGDEFPEVVKAITDTGDLPDDLQAKLKKIIEDFRSHFGEKAAERK